MLNNALSDKAVSIDISFPEIEKFDHLPEPKTNGVTAFVILPQ
jgi:tRNA-2-methylthio-N6-dimethylallyladenosine synthase